MIRLLAKRGIGILITDHNVRDTLEITDRAIIVNQGTIMTQGTKQEILSSDVAREIYLGKDFSMQNFLMCLYVFPENKFKKIGFLLI